MKKLLFSFAFIAIVWNLAYAEELKECESDEDKISGCVVKEYYDNGHSETPYKNGKIEGIRKEYYENGNLAEEAPYKNDEREGIKKAYYKNGNLQLKVPFKNGKLEGIVKLYYENGNLKVEIPYKNGKGEGIGKLYYENGDVAFSITFEDNEIISGKCANGKVVNADEIGLRYTFSDSDIKKICGD